MYDVLYHADWSTDPRKRWMAAARRDGGRWIVSAPAPVGDVGAFRDRILAAGERTLAGFDFPIGVPAAYGAMTGLADFPTALQVFGKHPDWTNFYTVGNTAAEISMRRPFYPNVSAKGVERAALVHGLQVASFADLLRACERGGVNRRTACALFWTLGGNQVGKAAIAGWREILQPAVASGARLWPFDGDLATLAASALTIAETYPADAYLMVGAPFLPSESKRRQSDRQAKAPALRAWAQSADVDLADGCLAQVDDGFGASASGEDAFDALAGLLKMIVIATGCRPEATEPFSDEVTRWEGWILGR